MTKPILLLVAVCSLPFLPILGYPFLNWDDPDGLLANPHLLDGTLRWAFTTTHMSHYQPLSWLVWSAVARMFGVEAGAFHALSLIVHLLNAALLFALARRVGVAAGWRAPDRAAAIAAFVFAVHPLRVEPVAWASAFPYLLALLFLLLSAVTYLRYAADGPLRYGCYAGSLACYAASLLSRAIAPGFPVVLLALDLYPLRRLRTHPRHVLVEKIPFFLLASAAVALESTARSFAGSERYDWLYRLTEAAKAPFVYLARTVWPFRLTPIDPLPLEASISPAELLLAAAALGAVSWVVLRRGAPLVAAWAAYLALLFPALGLAPSGLQATADRYTYLPGVALAIAAGAFLVRRPILGVSRAAFAGVLGFILLSVTWRQVGFWRDSVTLWTRAVELDARNDVAIYNLAAALSAAGRQEEAIDRYRQVLDVVPDHAPARRSLAFLEANRLERRAGELAGSGRLAEAVETYREALARDPARLRARAALGFALFQLGRIDEAVPELERVAGTDAWTPELANILAFAYAGRGDADRAASVLTRTLDRYPDDPGVMHNLARILATTESLKEKEAPRALELALAVVSSTRGEDPRALDTLAAAYAANERYEEAADAAVRAGRLARERGDREMAEEIAARERAYRARGPRSR